jgi:hypothetical protein
MFDKNSVGFDWTKNSLVTCLEQGR